VITRSRPLEAIGLVLGCWTVFRIGSYLPTQSAPTPKAPELARSTDAGRSRPLPGVGTALAGQPTADVPSAGPQKADGAATEPRQSHRSARVDKKQKFGPPQRLSAASVASNHFAPLSGESSAAPRPQAQSLGIASSPAGSELQQSHKRDQSPFSGSAWILFRPQSSGQKLADFGQLGGSQAGVRLYLPLRRGVRLTGRVSMPLSGVGTDASLGVALKARQLPVELLVERRFALDRGSRNAFSATLTSSIASRSIVRGWQVEGYGQAGLVGIRHPSLFADGALRLTKAIARTGKIKLEAGGGVWAAAQQGVSRLDAGPAVSVLTPAFRASFEWRQRLAGNAKPSSGPSVTLSSSF
jgi:hypothetical protein